MSSESSGMMCLCGFHQCAIFLASPNESFVNDLLASEIVQEELDDDDVVEFREYLEKLIEKFVSVKALVQTGCFASEKDGTNWCRRCGPAW